MTLTGGTGRVDQLITVNGRMLFPEEGGYSAPRWYIDVVDMVYLMLSLNSGLMA